eukprot:m.466616 g.466616  ORF g.466616 m.466616 type:complete len:271 (+) comp21630_c0_seq17:146-958(+)
MAKIVLLTGCSTGIGYTTAEHLSAAGNTVYATMRNVDCDGGKSLRQLAHSQNLKLNVIALDVNDTTACTATVDSIVKRHGRIDVLVNNAGVGSVHPFEETSEAAFRQMMETNFFGPIKLMQLVLPHMRLQRDGCIVNVSSIAGMVATMCQAGYCASKHALEAASESTALEVQQFGVRIKLVEPGVILTKILTKTSAEPGNGAERQVFDKASPYLAAMRCGTAARALNGCESHRSSHVRHVHEAPVSSWHRRRTTARSASARWSSGRCHVA